ncbi:hypothetical protein [Cobetia marina]|uniref:hypothetical protein n=1 Tax=Cobetia marina TaxID=28258 RepID=UPI00384A6482
MKRKLIIHIGMGKTGSSSIQKSLRLSRNKLEAKGLLYLGLMFEHINIPTNYSWHKVDGWSNFISLNKSQANSELAHTLQYLDAHLDDSIHTLIWSNEALFDRPSDVLSALNSISSRYQIIVVGYLRRPDKWISSAYLQWGLKDKSYIGPIKTFNEWVSDKPYTVSPKLDTWNTLSESVYFYNFDDIKDVSIHFIKGVLELDISDIKPVRENDTPPPAAMALFSYYNSFFNERNSPNRVEQLLQKTGCYESSPSSADFNELIPSKEDIIIYLNKCGEELTKINEYLIKNNQNELNINEVSHKDLHITQSDINRILLKIILELNSEIETLKLKNK